MPFSSNDGRDGQDNDSEERVNLSAELMDRLVAMRPEHTKLLDTAHGECEAMYSTILKINEDASFESYEDQPVFWRYVRQQLSNATLQAPWVAGRLVRTPRGAFKLARLGPAEEESVKKALASYSN